MKKLAYLLMIAGLFTLVACGEKKEEGAAEATETMEQPAEAPAAETPAPADSTAAAPAPAPAH
jgi:hypothetical protein